MTFSGQVAAQSPHCTQASSVNFSIGRSGSAESAPVGQADTQARHNVQPSTLTSTVPNGAPAGSAIISTGAGAARCNSRNASRCTSRLPPTGRNDAGCDVAAPGAMPCSASPKASGSSVSIVATRAAAEAEAEQDRRRKRRWSGASRRRRAVAARAAESGSRSRHRRSDAAIASSPTCVVSLTATGMHIGRQAVAVAREGVDHLGAMRLIVNQQYRIAAAGLAVRGQHRAQPAASRHRRPARHSRRRRWGRRPRIDRSRHRYADQSRRDCRRA